MDSHGLKSAKRKRTRVQSAVKPYTCNECDRRLSSSSAFRRHQRIHSGEKPYACGQCDSKFARSGNLKTHQRTHTGEKPFDCNQCDAKFSDPSALIRHKRIHSGEKPYACDQCDAKFTAANSLQAHIRGHTGEKPYTCHECDSRFTAANSLKDHKLLHTGEKPYVCDQCGTSFRQISTLKSHRLIHTGEKPYICAQCEAKFRSRSDLKAHQRIHTGEKPYLCDQCDAKFTKSGSLKTHKIAWHSLEGMNRKKKQQQRLRTVLQTKFSVDEEITIAYQNGCVPDPDKYRARVDFHLPEIISALIIVECDEMAHKGYQLSCELSRMEQIHEALIRKNEKPVVFIRYNPNGPLYEDGIKKQINRPKREMVLLSLLEDIHRERIHFTKVLTIVYLFYSMKNGIPEICLDEKYSKQMYGCVDLTCSARGFDNKQCHVELPSAC
jgi:DNA-directed RNA polymerase subunit RPC12/RpoP